MKFVKSVLALACCVAACAQSLPELKPDVAGITADSKGAPLRKVDLMLLPLATNAVGEPMPSYCVVSASDGKFEFYGIPPGRYRLMADRAGYLRTRFGAKTPAGSGTVVTVRLGAPVTGLEVRLPEQAVMSGKVVHDGPANSMYLALLQERYQDGRRQMTAVTSAGIERSGEFLFNKLTPGRYHLLARPMTPFGADPGADEEIALPTFYPGTSDQGKAEPIVVRGGQNINVELKVQKSRAFRVSGSVAGLPPNAGRVAVSMRAAAESLVSTPSAAIVGPDGTFQFSVPPGSYVLIASVPDAAGPRLVYQPVNVQGEVAGMVLKTEQATVLRGTFRVEGAHPAIPQLRLGLALTTPPYLSFGALSEPDGSFTSRTLIPGRYRYAPLDLPSGAYLKSAKLGDKDALSGLDLTEPAPDARLELVISYAGASIEGAVRDEQGKAVEGVATLIPDPPQAEQPWLYKTAEIDESGRFQFQGIRPGKYRLYAWEEIEAGAQFDPKVTAPFEARSVAIELAERDRKEVSVGRISVEEMDRSQREP